MSGSIFSSSPSDQPPSDHEEDDNSNSDSAADGSDSDDVQESLKVEDKRTIATLQQLKTFDSTFSKKKWNKLKDKDKKEISAALHLTKDEAIGNSKNSLTPDRKHFLSALRGLYHLLYDSRTSMEEQDDAAEAFGQIYKCGRYYKYANTKLSNFFVLL